MAKETSVIASFMVAILVGAAIFGAIVFFGKIGSSGSEVSKLSMEFASDIAPVKKEANLVVSEAIEAVKEVAHETGEIAVSAYHHAADFVSYPFTNSN